MRIGVFASASMNQYEDNVKELGRALGHAGHSLVYGGCAFGLMDAVAAGFAEAGAEMLAAVPKVFETAPVHKACSQVVITENLTDRKEWMIDHSDAFLILPGGIGTMDELFTVLAQKTIGQHAKPVILYAPDQYYDGLMTVLEEMHQHGAIPDPIEGFLVYCHTKEEVLLNLGSGK